jgi:hypothetical protein
MHNSLIDGITVIAVLVLSMPIFIGILQYTLTQLNTDKIKELYIQIVTNWF